MSISLNTDINSVMSNLNASKTGAAKAADLESSLRSLRDADNATDEELMQACKSFEAYMVEQVMTRVKEAIVPSEEDENQYLTMFKSKLYEEYAGQIVERGSAYQMVFDPVHPYSRGLMRSILVPEEGTRDVKLTAIPGTPPNLKHPPAGCRFFERCRYANAACQYNQMPLVEFEEGRTYRCGHSVEHLREVYAREDE